MTAELKTTLERDVIGRPQNQRVAVKVLGLGRVNSIATKPANEAIKGMTNTIPYLVDVEEV